MYRPTVFLSIISILFLMLFNTQKMNGQIITPLPSLVQGEYIVDSITENSGVISLGSNGRGDFSSQVSNELATGVAFKLVIDSIGPGSATGDPEVAQYIDGSWEPIYQGDTLPLPVSIQIYTGEISFHHIIEGTPTVGGEEYPCDLELAFTLGDDYGSMIVQRSDDLCQVEPIAGRNNPVSRKDFIAYPVPASNTIAVRAPNVFNP
jgi:hypothetical protein